MELAQIPIYNRPPWNLILRESPGLTPEELNQIQDPVERERGRRRWKLTLSNTRDAAGVQALTRELEGLGVAIVDPNRFIIELPIAVPPYIFFTQQLGLVPETFKQIPLWQAFKEEQAAYSPAQLAQETDPKQREAKQHQWLLILDQQYMKSTGIPIDRLKNLLGALTIPVDEVTVDWIKVTIPTNDSPSAYARLTLGQIKPTMVPRKLTPDEIVDILNSIPHVLGADQTSATSVRNSIINSLAEQLTEIILTPLGLLDLKEDIIRKFNNSRIAPGSTVGVTAAEALGGPITQMALNSFHASGSAKNVSYGVDAMRELLNASKVRRHENTNIYFKRTDLTFEDIIAKRSELVEINLANLMTNYDIQTPTALSSPWWYPVYQASTGRWIKNVTGKDFSEISWVLRLNFDINALYANRVTMEQIVVAIEQYNATNRTVFIIPSPISLGIIDIFPDENRIIEPLKTLHLFTEEFAPYTFLHQIVKPALSEIIIRGITGIKRMFPEDSRVWRIIKDEIKVYNQEQINAEPAAEMKSIMQRMWYLVYNHTQIADTGIRPAKLQQLIEASGLVLAKEEDDYMVVIMPEIPVKLLEDERKKNEKERRNFLKPGVWVDYQINEDLAEKRKIEKERRSAGDEYYVRPPTPLERASQFYYAATDGSNLAAFLARDDVDATRTICNNVHEVYRTLGIEAARTFLIKEIYFVIRQEEGDINPRHITLLVDFMSNLGEPTPITFSGVSRMSTGHLAKASNEKAMNIFTDAALFAKKEAIKGVSPSIYVGQRARIGTGYFDVLVDDRAVQEYETKTKEEQARTGRVAKPNVKEFMNDFHTMGDIIFAVGKTQAEDPDAQLDELFGEAAGEVIPEIPGALTVTDHPPITATENPQIKAKPVVPQLVKDVFQQINIAPPAAGKPPAPVKFVEAPLAPNIQATAPLTTVPVAPPELPLAPVKETGLGINPLLAGLMKQAAATPIAAPKLTLPPAAKAPATKTPAPPTLNLNIFAKPAPKK